MSPSIHVHVPPKGNAKLERFMEAVNANEEIQQLWRCANMNAVKRSGMSDHGPVHVQIVSNAAYKILRLLMEGGVKPTVVTDWDLSTDDAGLIVVASALLHDVGMSIQRENHEIYSLPLALGVLKPMLSEFYDVPTRTIIISEILHCIIAHQTPEVCLTVEAGCVKVGDALDMTHGRSRIPFESGKINIHSASAYAIQTVNIRAGDRKPVHVEILMTNFAGIFQLDELLKPKLRASSIADYVEVSASITAERGENLALVYSL